MKKIYKPLEKWSDEEKKYKKASFKTLVDLYFENRLLCNNILDLDENLFDCLEVGSLEDENGDYKEIFQFFLVDLNSWDLESLQELEEANNDDSIILFYCNKLDLYVLGVDHLGTSWDYVMTNIKLTTDLEEIL